MLLTKAGGLGFSPFAVGTPALWLSSRYPSSLWKERTTPTTQATLNGDVVGTWMDLSGNARHVTAPSDASRPTLATGSLNGWSGVLFDGADDVLSVSSFLTNVTDATYFIVMNRTAGTFCWNNYDGTTAGGMYVGCVNSSSYYMYSRPLISGTYNTPIAAQITGITPTNFGIVSGYYSSVGGVKIYGNGVLGATADTTPSTNLGGYSLFSLGCSLRNNSGYGAGNAAEVIIYPSALTTSQRQYIERGLGRAYGITVA